MSFNKFKTNSYCVGGRHYSGTNNIYGDINDKGVKFLRGKCSVCQRNKSMTVSDNTIQAEGLGKVSKAIGKAAVGFGKKVANNPGRALEVGANLATAIASRKPSAVLSQTPDLIKFATTGKGITITDNNTKKPIAVVKGKYSSTIKGNGLYLRREKR